MNTIIKNFISNILGDETRRGSINRYIASQIFATLLLLVLTLDSPVPFVFEVEDLKLYFAVLAYFAFCNFIYEIMRFPEISRKFDTVDKKSVEKDQTSTHQVDKGFKNDDNR